MTTAPMKSQQLHNFSLPFLKWGATTTHQQNRSRIQPAADSSEPENDSSELDFPTRPPPRVGSRSSRVQRCSFTKLRKVAPEKPKKETVLEEEVTEKVVKVKEETKNEIEDEEDEEEEEERVGKPWNLRPRKGVNCKKNEEVVVMEEAFANMGVLGCDNNQQIVNGNGIGKPKSMRLREMVESRGNHGERKEKSKFWVTLSKEEIEEDVFIMTGSRPSRRPRKRPRNVQKQLDNVFPGLWLVGVTVDSYRITDAPMKK